VGWRTPDGKARFKSTKCAHEADARKHLAAVESLFSARASGAPLDEVYASLSPRTKPRPTVKAALRDWLTECEGSTATETLGRYQTIADAFSNHLGAGEHGPMLDAVTSEHIREFLTKRRAGRNASTINLERKILSMHYCPVKNPGKSG